MPQKSTKNTKMKKNGKAATHAEDAKNQKGGKHRANRTNGTYASRKRLFAGVAADLMSSPHTWRRKWFTIPELAEYLRDFKCLDPNPCRGGKPLSKAGKLENQVIEECAGLLEHLLVRRATDFGEDIPF